MKTFQKHLKKEMQNKKFAKAYREEKELAELAIKIAETRAAYHLTQKELASKANITQQQLSKVENGENCYMTTLLKIFRALDLDFSLCSAVRKI